MTLKAEAIAVLNTAQDCYIEKVISSNSAKSETAEVWKAFNIVRDVLECSTDKESRESETIETAITLLQAYQLDLDYWLGQGHEHWTFCGNGTPCFTEKEAKQEMSKYLNTVIETIKRLKEIKS